MSKATNQVQSRDAGNSAYISIGSLGSRLSRVKFRFASVRSPGRSTFNASLHWCIWPDKDKCESAFRFSVVSLSCQQFLHSSRKSGQVYLLVITLFAPTYLPTSTATALFMLNLITRTWSMSMRPRNAVKHTRIQESGSEAVAQFPQQRAGTGLMMNPLRWSLKFHFT